ncbi:MAG: precorrin-2 C(20)-methyltransferase [Thermodesulfovibrionales bacterium]|nr:precorrin-2 C(20)-methyltransferase [Nitrospinota bacterium]MCG2709061.1 precorrin-2 C(20)-methyltransferase [Thermodesulfovibrionales bacterium]MDP3049280.1 precorrin-2 C(20)-methyltransferase [Thermodesulfovibrionales bacterium]
MRGKLYVIGVGPGDPELLTLKAARILREVKCICVPKGREEGSSLALSIVKKALSLDNKEIIEAHFPMKKTKTSRQSEDSELDNKWAETVKNILSRLNKGIDVAFITIGDPAIYSTFFYLYDRLIESNPELKIDVIPGVSSINASAAKAKISLGLADEKIAILPANYIENLKETLEKFDTVVLMKVNKVFEGIMHTLTEMNLLNNAIYISRAGMEDEKVFKNINSVKEEDLNYFSMIIVKK